jgi:nucleotide-binding universal stress UspA family protein
MTSDVLAVVEPDDVGLVETVASALAQLLTARVRHLAIDDVSDPVESASLTLDVLAGPDIVIAVLSGAARHLDLDWAVLQHCDKPVLLVPPNERLRTYGIGRALVPLDGTPESAAAVAETMALLARAGVDIVVLHVFQPDTVPRFWDHSVHAETAWQSEFLSRYCADQDVRLEVRSGEPGESIGHIASVERVDLIVLGWSQRLEPGRARTVRSAVASSAVPVLLVPLRTGG